MILFKISNTFRQTNKMNNFKHRSMAFCGSLLCLFAVAIGAFGAHALKEILVANDRIDVFELSNRYQFYHGLALLAFATLSNESPKHPSLKLISLLMLLGVIIFSGSLYALALSNVGIFGAITPIGGVLLIASWGLFSWRILKT